MKNICLFLLIAAATFGGCKKDELGGDLGNPLPGGKVLITLNADMGSFIKPVKSRAGMADEDNKGDNVWVFILEKMTVSSADYTLRIIENRTITADGKVDIVAEKTTNPITIILLANAPSKYTDQNGVERDFTLENLEHITSYSELKQTLSTKALQSPALSVPYTPSGVIPMSGKVDFESGINTSVSVNILLKRIVAKISVETELPTSKFTLLGTSVCNAPRSGWLLPPNTLWRDNSSSLTNYSHDDIECRAIQVASKQTTTSNPIYIYESRPEEQTAVIIKAVYNNGTYFYKIAMAEDYSVNGSGRQAKNLYIRNFAYKYIITDVRGTGYSTFDEACNSAPSNNIKSAIDVIDLTSHDIMDNGEYFLGVSNSEYVIYATGARSDLSAVTLSTGGNSNLPFNGTITASDGITITNGDIFNHPQTGKEVTIKVDDKFSKGTITIKLGNLTKVINVVREYTTPFDGRNISTYGTDQYVVGQIESVSHNSGGDWIGLSQTAKGLDLGRREIVNNQGGIYIHLGVNWDKTAGIAGRNATLYLSRKTGAGRIKVYLEQDYIDSRSIDDDEKDLPENMDPFVGAFWRANQIAERLILIPRPESGAIDGYWYATTLLYGQGWDEAHGDGILMDTKPTKDPYVNFESTANEDKVTHGDQLEGNPDYLVSDNHGDVGGEVSVSQPMIYFRVGLQKPIADNKVRYAVLILTYTCHKPNGETKLQRQRIFIRQGHASDYLIRPTDNFGSIARPYAKKWSPYNLTDPAANDNYDMTSRSAGNGLVTHKGATFTQYPSQAGYYFSFYGRMAFSPKVSTTNILPMINTFLMDMKQGRSVSGNVDSDEVCPEGYHTPRDGENYQIPHRASGIVQNSEVRQSLFINPVDGDRPNNLVYESDLNQVKGVDAGTIVGFYADSYSDRLMRQTPYRNNFVVRKNCAVGLNSDKVAYIGRLFYNPITYASIFMPYSGSFAPNPNGYPDSWPDGNNAPYFMGEHAVYGTSTKRLEYDEVHANGYQMVYVGFAEKQEYVPTLVAVAPWKIYSFANIRCVAD